MRASRRVVYKSTAHVLTANKINLYKILSRSTFSNDFRVVLFCLDIEEKCLLLPYYAK